jgi:hypothetical protein
LQKSIKVFKSFKTRITGKRSCMCTVNYWKFFKTLTICK